MSGAWCKLSSSLDQVLRSACPGLIPSLQVRQQEQVSITSNKKANVKPNKQLDGPRQWLAIHRTLSFKDVDD